jgi:hypothetical protein
MGETINVTKMISCRFFEGHDSGAYCRKDKWKPIDRYGEKCKNCEHYKGKIPKI